MTVLGNKTMTSKSTRSSKLPHLLYICSLFVACSETVQVGDSQTKEPKKKTSENSGASDNDATEPQVVTGGYLACVQDSRGSKITGEVSFGCGVYDKTTDTKKDLTGHKLVLSAVDASGQPLKGRQVDDEASSNFHSHFILTTRDPSDISISATVTSSDGTTSTLKNRPVKLNLTKKTNFEDDYTKEEISAWCGLITTIPFDPKSLESNIAMGNACGVDYLNKNGSSYSFITMFVGISNETNEGICEKKDATSNRDLNVERCKKTTVSEPDATPGR